MMYFFYLVKFHISAYRHMKLREWIVKSDNALLINRRKLRVENNNIPVNKLFKDIFAQ